MTLIPRVVALLLAGAVAVGQRPADDDEKALVDPWTEGEDQAELQEALGYVRVGPMPWGDGHGSSKIEEVLGEDRYRFVETAHFRIASALPPCGVPREKDRRKQLVAELEELEKKLPELNPKRVKVLDPWLRTHLFAQRAENLYARIQELLGVTDEDFPGPDAPFFRNQVPPHVEWMGRGPNLGMKGKFLLLLCEKESDCARYLTAFTGATGETPSRWYFPESDSFLFATAVEFHEGVYESEPRLHAHIVFNLTHNLLDAFKGYSYNAPTWWKEGLAHEFRREVLKEHNEFSALDSGEDSQRAYGTFDWGRIIKQRAGFGIVRPFGEIVTKLKPDEFTLIDHMACWSRVDFLLDTRGPEKVALFADRINGFVDTQGRPPTEEALLARQREAIQEAFGKDVEALDAEWHEWVEKRKVDD